MQMQFRFFSLRGEWKVLLVVIVAQEKRLGKEKTAFYNA